MNSDVIAVGNHQRRELRSASLPLSSARRRRRIVTALLYPWYEVRFYPAADTRTSRCPDDWIYVSIPDVSGGGRDG